MGRCNFKIDFTEALPAAALLLERLRERTSIEITQQEVTYNHTTRQQKHLTRGWSGEIPRYHHFTFHLPEKGLAAKNIQCKFFHQKRVVTFDADIDLLNKCPFYLESVLVSCLIDLGGEYQHKADIPEYAYLTWQQWKKLNGGAQPPSYKVLLYSLGLLIYLLLMAIFCLFTWVPLLFLMLIAGWGIFIFAGRKTMTRFLEWYAVHLNRLI